MKYNPAKNYPLDLYYLMDVTKTMMDFKNTLLNIGQNLSIALSKLTRNFRIGFGTFVDKPIAPFIMLGTEANPCSTIRQTCIPTFDFHHQLSMTTNVSKFVEKVRMIEMSANLDDLEGGFDALMQILVCNENIGWSDRSRKIVVYASDGKIHFAGDGILAGIVNRNDKQCHLDDDGRYAGALDQDYPSVEEMYRVLLQKKINVIFAVTRNVTELYDQLHNLMQEISSVGVLANDSSNILELVESGYLSFVNRVQFSDNSPEYINIEYETTCNGYYLKPMKVSHCENVKIDGEYEFNIKVTLNELPQNFSEFVRIVSYSSKILVNL